MLPGRFDGRWGAPQQGDHHADRHDRADQPQDRPDAPERPAPREGAGQGDDAADPGARAAARAAAHPAPGAGLHQLPEAGPQPADLQLVAAWAPPLPERCHGGCGTAQRYLSHAGWCTHHWRLLPDQHRQALAAASDPSAYARALAAARTAVAAEAALAQGRVRGMTRLFRAFYVNAIFSDETSKSHSHAVAARHVDQPPRRPRPLSSGGLLGYGVFAFEELDRTPTFRLNVSPNPRLAAPRHVSASTQARVSALAGARFNRGGHASDDNDETQNQDQQAAHAPDSPAAVIALQHCAIVQAVCALRCNEFVPCPSERSPKIGEVYRQDIFPPTERRNAQIKNENRRSNTAECSAAVAASAHDIAEGLARGELRRIFGQAQAWSWSAERLKGNWHSVHGAGHDCAEAAGQKEARKSRFQAQISRRGSERTLGRIRPGQGNRGGVAFPSELIFSVAEFLGFLVIISPSPRLIKRPHRQGAAMKSIIDIDRELALKSEIAALKARLAICEDALADLKAPLPPAPEPAPPRPKDVAEHDPPLLAFSPAGTCDWNACLRPLTSPPAPMCGSPERHEGGCC